MNASGGPGRRRFAIPLLSLLLLAHLAIPIVTGTGAAVLARLGQVSGLVAIVRSGSRNKRRSSRRGEPQRPENRSPKDSVRGEFVQAGGLDIRAADRRSQRVHPVVAVDVEVRLVQLFHAS